MVNEKQHAARRCSIFRARVDGECGDVVVQGKQTEYPRGTCRDLSRTVQTHDRKGEPVARPN